MPQSFFKRCAECQKGFLAQKKAWKLARRVKAIRPVPVCMSHIFESRMVVFPYIPLLEPVKV